jgi:hypothetical protein
MTDASSRSSDADGSASAASEERPTIDGPLAWIGRLAVVAVVVVAALFSARLIGSSADLACPRSGDQSSGAGRGSAIVALELAGTPARADNVLAACGASAGTARTALYRDFGFIAFYGVVLAVGVAYFGPRGFRVKALRQRSKALVIAVVVAAGLDVVENLALLRFLGIDSGSRWAKVLAGGAATAAWGKFVLLFVVLLYLVIAMAGYVVTPRWVVERRDRLTRFREASGTDFHPLGALKQTLLTAGSPRGTATDGEEPPSGFVGRNVPDRPDVTRRGIALSGGGIRSASFGLGALQTLEGRGDLRWDAVQRVTAVSGGAYLAGAWTIARGLQPTPAASPAPWAEGSPEETHLRRNLGYLLKASGGVPGALFTLLVGLAINVAVLVLLLLVLARTVGLVVGSCVVSPQLRVPGDLGAACMQLAPGTSGDLPLVGGYQWTPALVWLGLGASMSLVWLALGKLRKWAIPRRVGAAAGRMVLPAIGIGGVLFVVLCAVPWAMVRLPEVFNHLAGEQSTVPQAGAAETQSILSSALKLAVAAGVVGAIVKAVKDPLAKRASKLGGVLLAFLAVLVGLEWARNAAVGDPWPNLVATALVLGVWLLAYWGTSSEWWSMAPFYRARLRRAFATYRDPATSPPAAGPAPGLDPEARAYEDGDEPIDEGDGSGPGRVEPSVYRYQPAAGGPEIEICCAMTVSDNSVKTHYGIPALSFRISPTKVEFFIPRTADQVAASYSCTPYQIEQLSHRWDSTRLTTMAAVGMSGAAFSPAMGRMSMGSTDALLAFANLRLGVWVPNPRYASVLPVTDAPPVAGDGTDPALRAKHWPSYPRVRPGYLLKELIGLHDTDDLYVYVTDGGHWENTSIVEQLRVGDLVEIVCLDGSGVAIDKLTSFAEAIDLAPLECDGVSIDARLDAMRAVPAEGGAPPYAERCCTIALARGEDFISLLWYAKPILTRDNEARLLAYWERDKRFPAHGTIDQFFDEEQFECYRLLGVAAAEEIAQARISLVFLLMNQPQLIGFNAIAAAPGAHWVAVELARLIRTQADYELLRTSLGL